MDGALATSQAAAQYHYRIAHLVLFQVIVVPLSPSSLGIGGASGSEPTAMMRAFMDHLSARFDAAGVDG